MPIATFAPRQLVHPLRISARQRASSLLEVRCQSQCYLVGAGPGDPELLTVKAARLLADADVVLYDDLGGSDVLSGCADGAELICVGKRGGRPSMKQPDIDELLVAKCKESQGTVVRLKGGCPSIFSRVASEIMVLRAAGIPYSIVPGISSALAAPLQAGFPLTDKDVGRAFAVTSVHDVEAVDWGPLCQLDTLVLLMGGRQLAGICSRVIEHGKPHSTPVVVVKNAATPQQQLWRGTIESIASDTTGVELSPCIIVIGYVTGLFDS